MSLVFFKMPLLFFFLSFFPTKVILITWQLGKVRSYFSSESLHFCRQTTEERTIASLVKSNPIKTVFWLEVQMCHKEAILYSASINEIWQECFSRSLSCSLSVHEVLALWLWGSNVSKMGEGREKNPVQKRSTWRFHQFISLNVIASLIRLCIFKPPYSPVSSG